MAHMNQEKKAKIAAALKQVVPAGWKYSLAVRHHSSIVMTISAAPVDLIGAHKKSEYFDPATETYTTVNNYHFRSHLADQSGGLANPSVAAPLCAGRAWRDDGGPC